MTDMQFGGILTVFGAGLTMFSLAVIAFIVSAMVRLQRPASGQGQADKPADRE